nr:hypothetical protein [uncultured Campylobacter sp.]
MKNNALKNLILKNIFVISKQPVLFRDLLEANCLFNEGMLIDPAKLNFKFRYARTYLVYGLLCFAIFFVLLILTHRLFTKLDFHLSIVSAVVGTSAVFIGFDMFKIWARKAVSKELIKKAWSVHFPYFSYEKYSTKVEMIYNEAVKNEIPRKDLEQYVLERLVAQSEAGN